MTNVEQRSHHHTCLGARMQWGGGMGGRVWLCGEALRHLCDTCGAEVGSPRAVTQECLSVFSVQLPPMHACGRAVA
eukprot:6186133-Pleurochrysis_carterae.AAC.2